MSELENQSMTDDHAALLARFLQIRRSSFKEAAQARILAEKRLFEVATAIIRPAPPPAGRSRHPSRR